MAVETGWEYLPETQKKLLDRGKWNKHVIEYYKNVLKEENSEVFIAEDEHHKYVGYLMVGQTRGTITELSFGYIYGIFVEEEFRGKGVGKLLLEKGEDYCRKKGHSRIALSVSATNDSAIKLYSRTGYKSERSARAHQSKKRHHNRLWMTLNLNDVFPFCTFDIFFFRISSFSLTRAFSML
jgi:ribosomal protein S18 acetylase RimI-like enzyme